MIAMTEEQYNQMMSMINAEMIGSQKAIDTSDNETSDVQEAGCGYGSEDCDTEVEYNADEHIIDLINQVTTNTLTRKDVISVDSATVLSILHSIKLDLAAE